MSPNDSPKRRYRTIKNLILVSMICVPLIPFLLILAVGFYYFKTAIETAAVDSLKLVVADHRHLIESFLNERRQDLVFAGRTYSFDEIQQPERLEEVFRNMQRDTRAFVDLGVFDVSGVHLAYHGPYALTGINYAETEWFREVVKHGYYISDVFLGFRQVPHFVIAVAVATPSGKWILRATVDPKTFSTLVQGIQIGATGEAFIVNRDGILQTERRSGGALMAPALAMGDLPPSLSGTTTFIHPDARGVDFLYATAWLKDKSWLLVVRQETGDVFHLLRSTILITVVISVLGGALILFSALYLTGRIIRRIEQTDAEKENLSQQLIGASRLAELGEMAAGFAHEINNPLQIIKGEQALIRAIFQDLKAARDAMPAQDVADLEDSLAQIDVQISRCARITQAILKFGRQDPPRSEQVPLKSFIDEMIAMVAGKAAVQGTRITSRLEPEDLQVYGDPAQLQQVMLNLLNNAVDAVAERFGSSGGRIEVDAARADDRFLEIRVTDNGCGIRPEHLERVFSPFFSTKPVGKGTGLGLSVCYGIVAHMGGRMGVHSDPGEGTVFWIRLPSAD